MAQHRSRSGVACKDIYFTVRDGLRLHARHYLAPGAVRRPVVCLPGLTRNAKDFHVLAEALAGPHGHRREVYCVDYRGRGLSEHDKDWRNYTPFIECLDVLDLMTLAGLHDVALIGTSRGGIIAMIMALLRPSAIGAVVLNDIGPVIDRDGLTRIIGYVGRVPLPATWEDAGKLVRDMNARQFTRVRDEEWIDVARQWFNDEAGMPHHSYDPELVRPLSAINSEGPPPPMWTQFKALARVPLLVIRGENSDILSTQTLTEMARVHPDMRSLVVPGQGHAPLLRDQPTIQAIADFLVETDVSHRDQDSIGAVA